ncbi:MAG: hypothetical protein J0I77_17720 [Rudaea sp.]|uniref:hypothetical protein n=1 Tax=unclassified Rudaea TaxID=2627037 RepID=UPI0010F5CD8D|nr:MULTISPECIES: hypothetical protein [unclassified Rudaea]MBN8887567.1 hypothetical protein [Rudaea sp.]
MREFWRRIAKEFVDLIKNLGLCISFLYIAGYVLYGKGHIFNEASTDRMFWTLYWISFVIGMIVFWLFAEAVYAEMRNSRAATWAPTTWCIIMGCAFSLVVFIMHFTANIIDFAHSQSTACAHVKTEASK